MANDREWSYSDLARFQLTGEYPEWYEPAPELKPKSRTKPVENPEPVPNLDVRP